MNVDSYPHICVDATCVVTDTKGVTVYAIALLIALQKLAPPVRITVLMRSEAVNLLDISNSSWSTIGVKFKSAHLWHIFVLPGLLGKLKADLLLVLGETPLTLLPIPYIFTVHELPHLYRKLVSNKKVSLYKYLSQSFTEMLLPSTCRRAVHLLAISQNTATDVIQEYKIDRDRITITYEAADSRFFQAQIQHSDWRQKIPHPYILIFATGDRREVPELVVKAFAKISHQLPHHLVIAGRCPEWQKSTLSETAVKLGCSQKLYFTGYVPDEDLPVLYRDADIYVEMSHYEGFGLQVCEAMSAGTAVIASNVASLPEIIGNAGYLVPLGDINTLTEKLFTHLTDSTQAEYMSRLARERATQFSWDRCAKETWTV
ncbi:MAG: glycosyltransferase family 4 protein, partial [Nostoc sp. C3-bin3]|nr:glycosyltransferase family 4 protein [Nostoc sp. C3-bin3]